nr:hypothetical protein Datr000117 [Darna trima granulovirus]
MAEPDNVCISCGKEDGDNMDLDTAEHLNDADENADNNENANNDHDFYNEESNKENIECCTRYL